MGSNWGWLEERKARLQFKSDWGYQVFYLHYFILLTGLNCFSLVHYSFIDVLIVFIQLGPIILPSEATKHEHLLCTY